MQMSRLYQSTNKKVRAHQLRRDALALRRAGFADSALQNEEHAELLDPTPREVSNQLQSDNKHSSYARKGSGSERVFNGDRQSDRTVPTGKALRGSKGGAVSAPMERGSVPTKQPGSQRGSVRAEQVTGRNQRRAA